MSERAGREYGGNDVLALGMGAKKRKKRQGGRKRCSDLIFWLLFYQEKSSSPQRQWAVEGIDNKAVLASKVRHL